MRSDSEAQKMRPPMLNRLSSPAKPGRREPSWRDYARKPRQRGQVSLSSHGRKWRGLAVDGRRRIRSVARRGISILLGATGDHPGAPDRLLRLLVEVSDTFGGRPIHIVSGYRTTSHYQDSRHKTSQAIDFSVSGVPNVIVRDYLRTLPGVGVGYYPNSTFLHLDVRPTKTYWVDYAGPGEAPRKSPNDIAVAASTELDDRAEAIVTSSGTGSEESNESSHDGEEDAARSAASSEGERRSEARTEDASRHAQRKSGSSAARK
jgi:hypothetical protein